MKTIDFIKKHKERIDRGEELKYTRGSYTEYCASVCTDTEVIYSYGSHYPLLFRIETPTGRKLWVCNNRGYSATTAKHISWASRFADIRTDIGCYESFTHTKDRMTYENILASVAQRKEKIQETMASKKRKDTHVYEMLELDLGRAESELELLNT